MQYLSGLFLPSVVQSATDKRWPIRIPWLGPMVGSDYLHLSSGCNSIYIHHIILFVTYFCLAVPFMSVQMQPIRGHHQLMCPTSKPTWDNHRWVFLESHTKELQICRFKLFPKGMVSRSVVLLLIPRDCHSNRCHFKIYLICLQHRMCHRRRWASNKESPRAACQLNIPSILFINKKVKKF